MGSNYFYGYIWIFCQQDNHALIFVRSQSESIPKRGICTLDSGIDVAPGINVASGTFGKNNKHSP